MLSKHPQMKLSREEEIFLRHWMYEETHYRAGRGPAKRLQFEHGVLSSDLAALIASAIPAPADQAAAGLGPPPGEPPAWPWSAQALDSRLAEARTLLAQRSGDGLGSVPRPCHADNSGHPGEMETNAIANAKA